MLKLLKRIRDDLLLRGELDGDTTVVNLSSGVWIELNYKIEELEYADEHARQAYDVCDNHTGRMA